ncbi:hypothetical protein DESPIG_01836 [Desulfovibrio piger ATCC 29098]|uniref:Uncharacterized protein n=1 Tax=Desulfovibrio piger ATCC 29098 TaxID=411464 RepID=B6WUS5_9BACT|nr:hypothetical protein DESPIG_01836 [Desulfovibrio piger ATCC 29098]
MVPGRGAQRTDAHKKRRRERITRSRRLRISRGNRRGMRHASPYITIQGTFPGTHVQTRTPDVQRT